MKNLICIVFAFVTLQATSQERKREMNHDNKKERMHERQDISPEDKAIILTKKMTLGLDLTEEQQIEIGKLNLENAKNRKANRESREKKGKNEKPSQEEYLKMINERLDDQIAAKKKMKKILNNEQYKKWEKQKEYKHRKGRERHGDKKRNKEHMKKHK